MEYYKTLIHGLRKPRRKLAVFMCGSPGAGKTTYREKHRQDMHIPSNVVVLNLDDIYARTKSYKSKDILNFCMMKAAEDGYSIYYEGTCRDSARSIEQLKILKRKGYFLKLGFVYADLDTVLNRVSKRVNQPTPESVVRHMYSQIHTHAHEYMDLNLLDEIYLFNNEKTSQLILYVQKKQIHCVSPHLKFYFDIAEYC
uniref:Zeta toxin domain-containing protein n=1 Tax=viral metagenome TaxID=1070528 RepID=A0A6C0JW16_9ZZZZ